MNSAVAKHLVNRKTPSLDGRSWREVFISSLKAVRENISGEMPELIFLTGGVSMIQNLPMYLQKEVSLPVYHIQDPKNSTIRGLITMINQKELHTLMRSPRR